MMTQLLILSLQQDIVAKNPSNLRHSSRMESCWYNPTPSSLLENITIAFRTSSIIPIASSTVLFRELHTNASTHHRTEIGSQLTPKKVRTSKLNSKSVTAAFNAQTSALHCFIWIVSMRFTCMQDARKIINFSRSSHFKLSGTRQLSEIR
jgi:hypothetical protein